MSFENAKANLKEFGKELSLELEFDDNSTCILAIDNTFSLHFTYEATSGRLYIYAPVADGLPKDDKLKLTLYEALLEASLLGGQMGGGGIGVAINEELVLMHYVLPMGDGADVFALSRFAPIFVECVERWRKRFKDIIEGRDRGATGIPGGGIPPVSGVTDRNQGGKPMDSKPKPDDGYIKI